MNDYQNIRNEILSLFWSYLVLLSVQLVHIFGSMSLETENLKQKQNKFVGWPPKRIFSLVVRFIGFEYKTAHQNNYEN